MQWNITFHFSDWKKKKKADNLDVCDGTGKGALSSPLSQNKSFFRRQLGRSDQNLK